MLMTLLSMFGGGLMRLLPEILGFLNKKTDNAHELAMLEKQFQLEQTRAAARLDEIRVQGDVDQTIALLDVQREALKGQMQKTGIRFVDALNFLVRPVTTYFFLSMYGIVKLATLVIAVRQADAWTAIVTVWTPDDATILAGILTFYFVGRSFDKAAGR